MYLIWYHSLSSWRLIQNVCIIAVAFFMKVWKTNKTQSDVLSGSLASYFEGAESKATGEL